MAISVSHAMRRYPVSPPDSKYSNYTSEDSSIAHQWSSIGRSEDNVGGSALSRSMRYAEPWLYGSMRAAPGGLVLAYPTPTIVLCSCTDYTTGTAKNSKKGPVQCKKCKGTRLPLAQGGTVRAKYGTVRGYPTASPAHTSVRAGTVRVSSSVRPSILPAVDPYDFMRRSRLSCSDNTGSQFRARSTSPNKTRDQRSTKNSPRTPSPLNLTLSRKSILECSVNPYELMTTNGETKDQNGIAINGQRMKIKSETDYEDVDLKVKKQSVSQIPVKLGQHKPRSTRRHIERETVSNRNHANKFKSILKKPSATFNDTDIVGTVVETTIKSPGSKSGSHFYLPMPHSSRKKVQFLVENEFTNQFAENDKMEIEEQETDISPEQVKFEDLPKEKEQNESELPVIEDDEDHKEPCRLKRSLSERLNHGSAVVTFHDTMALRSRNRPALLDAGTALFDSITDLQRLDGVGPARSRPREPPPPPPPLPPSGQEMATDRPATPPPRSRTESESGYDVTTLKETFKESGSDLLQIKDHEAKDSKTNVNNKQRNDNKTVSASDKKYFPNKQADKLDYLKETNQIKPELQNSNNEIKNIKNAGPYITTPILENGFREIKKDAMRQIQNFSPPDSPPPIVPPRKRSNSKTPLVPPALKKVNETIKDTPKSNINLVTPEISPMINIKSNENTPENKIKPKIYGESSDKKKIPDPEGEYTFNDKYISKNYQTVRIEANEINYNDMTTVDNVSFGSPAHIGNVENKLQTIKIEPSRTIVQINSPTIQVTPSAVHRLQIRNEFPDHNNIQSVSVLESPQRKTSIMINGDDCYSTVNVNDDIPIYQSSVVVNDCDSNKMKKNSGGVRSSVYITGDFQTNYISTPLSSRTNNIEDTSSKTLVIFDNNSSITSKSSPSISSENSTPETIGKTFVFLPPQNEQQKIEKKNEINNRLKQIEVKDIPMEKPSNEELQRLLKDPVEAVKRNLIPHVCGKADVERKPRNKKLISSNTLVARLLEDPFLGSLAEGLETDTVAKLIEDSLLKLRNQENLPDDDKDISSENESCPPYELMEAGSDCYSNHSNRSSVTEDELNTRSKFYQLLADAALTEVEEHHYESIRPNTDPIYEEIEIPPPLPANPPPSSLVDDLQIDKQFTTRSIFEGASKYDILSYLVDAKERGIIPEESYTYNFNNSGEVIVEEEEEDTKERRRVFSSRVSHMSTVSDSSEDSSLVITADKNGPQKSAEVERNDSGVGSETSKCSRSRYLTQPEALLACEDCELPVDPTPEDGPLICRKCSKKRSERKEIITEIVETEEKYSRDLQIILEEFYQPMLVAGLLTPEQLSAIFLNVEELLENSQALAERLRDTLEIAVEQGDEDLLTVNIGKIILEAAPMLHAFESYCVRQGAASLLLASLEKDKELLRIFLRVSQMENTMLRRMNLNSFLMVPVQRVTKYPLLLARLHKVTPIHHSSRELLRESQHKIELHLNHMNSETRDVPSKLWRRISSGSGRRSSSEMDLVNIKLRKIAVDVLEWNHDEARFALEGRLLFTQPTDNNWRKGRTIKLAPVNAMLVTNGKPGTTNRPDRNTDDGTLAFPRQTGIREAALLLVRDKGGRYSLLREPLYLDRCVIATDPAWQSYFEVQELLGKDTFIFKAEDPEMTRSWYRQLQYHAQGMGAWRKRRNALANIMINGMGSRT